MNFGWLQTAISFLIIFTTLVFFHELGHFLLAKFFKMKVEEFAIGMGPRLIKLFTRGDTDYTIRAFPLGGFVRIAGMEIEDGVESKLTGSGSSPETQAIRERNNEHLNRTPGIHTGAGNSGTYRELNRALDKIEAESEFTTTNVGTLEQEATDVANEDPNGFNSRPIYQRFWVILAGPVFSFLLGWIALCLIGVTTGMPSKSLLGISQVQVGSVAQQVGLHNGDIIETINGKTYDDWEWALDTIRTSAGKQVTLTVRPEGDTKSPPRIITATPRPEKDSSTGETVGRLGFTPLPHATNYKRTSLAESFQFGNNSVVLWFRTMGSLVSSGKIKDSLGGPIAIVKETAGASKRGPSDLMMLLGQLSLSLGLFNLFPIPVLDGGHLMLMAVEAIRGRKLTAEQTGRVLTAGLAVLAVIFVLVLFKDVRGLFSRG